MCQNCDSPTIATVCYILNETIMLLKLMSILKSHAPYKYDSFCTVKNTSGLFFMVPAQSEFASKACVNTLGVSFYLIH